MYIFELFKSFALKALRHLGYDIRKVSKIIRQSPYNRSVLLHPMLHGIKIAPL